MADTALEALEFHRVLTLIAMEARSAPGKRAVANRHPLKTAAACARAQTDLTEMLRFYHQEGLLPMAGLTEVAPLLAGEEVLDLEESWQVVRAVRATQAIREALSRAADYPHLRTLSETIPALDELVTRSAKYFTRDGKLREEASAELRAIRGRIHTKRAAIQRLLGDIMNRSSGAIQEPLIVMRGDRYCIPVRSDHRNAVPGILHERSGSGASFFIEPIAAVELNNDLADLLIQEREEIARILRFISQMLMDDAGEIEAAVAAAGEIDALQACAIFGDTVRSSRPDFSDTRRLTIVEGRHPLLDERLAAARQETFGEMPSGQAVVPITVKLDGNAPALIVSGPNAGGKTVALKTAGLLVAMGMSGLPVPAAEGTVLPVIDGLHVLIGDDQSVLEHLSTFSAYLVRLKRILSGATDRSLVLLDELGSGTDPEEGAALAAATIEHFLAAGSLLIVTTHLSALKGFAVNDPRIVNASMEFDAATGRSTYRLIVGIPGRSRAIDVAETIGLPLSLIAAARERLGDRYGETDRMLAELQKRMSEVLAQQDEVTRLREELERERRAAAAAAEKLEAERKKVGTSFREELERVKDDVSRQVAAEIRGLREAERAGRVDAAEVLRTVTRPLEKAIEFIPAEQREVHAGDRAEHRKFKIAGAVVSIDGKRAVLNVNGRKMTVDVGDLVPLVGARVSSPARSKPARGRTPAAPDSDAVQVSAELNLIGQRVDDALEESDKFLDRALLEGKQAVRIIHGFGTGTLRKAIREHLKKHPAVVSWRPGGDNEGGDGATIAVLE
ncbi:MAG TPA: Smr/MutS family protein [Thermoanaerobaculia bacterium]|nr:Smr/MutS family protein [Thermoanaerobaculia bacterium]